MDLTEKEKTTLLDIVKKAITAKFNDKEMPILTLESQTLKERRGEKTWPFARLYRLHKSS